MFDFIAEKLGKFLFLIYENIHNLSGFYSYGLALIIFTIIVKLILLPLNVKQTKSMRKIQDLQPQMQEIQKRYKDDKQKLQMETMKLYQENKVNPAAGCLPLLIQLPILFSLFYVFSKPLTYMIGLKEGEITKLQDALKISSASTGYPEVEVIQKLSELPQNIASTISPDLVNLKHGMSFLGIDLSSIPSFSGPWIVLIIPILAVVTTYLSTKISFASTGSYSNASNAAMQKSMLYIAPVLTLIFAFRFPVGLALYWTVGYIFQIFQQLYMNKYVLKIKKEVANK